MTDYLFAPPEAVSLPVEGDDARYPVARVFCVGRNYVAHAKEMGGEVDREAPWYFTKSLSAGVEGGATVPYPPGTANYHHEMEFVIAIGAPAFRVSLEDAPKAVFGYAAGLDMTRRDLQQIAKDNRRPWSLAKDCENAAVVAPITRAEAFGAVGPQRIALTVNGEARQDATLADMVWNVAEIIADLSRFYHLAPGDLIFTGTPAGVGAVVAGDRIEGVVEGLAPVELTLGPAE